jgi:hypothetical protein
LCVLDGGKTPKKRYAFVFWESINDGDERGEPSASLPVKSLWLFPQRPFLFACDSVRYLSLREFRRREYSPRTPENLNEVHKAQEAARKAIATAIRGLVRAQPIVETGVFTAGSTF